MSQTERPQGAEHPVDKGFDPPGPDYLAVPYPYYERSRREAPFFYAPKLDYRVVSRYGDVQEIVKDPETHLKRRPPVG